MKKIITLCLNAFMLFCTTILSFVFVTTLPQGNYVGSLIILLLALIFIFCFIKFNKYMNEKGIAKEKSQINVGKTFKNVSIFLIIVFVISVGFLVYDKITNPQKVGSDDKITEKEENKDFDYDDADNFDYIVNKLTTLIGESPNFKWTDSIDWVDEKTQIQYFKGYIQYNDLEIPYNARFAGDKCVHFNYGGETYISDIDTEAAWMDEHNK